MNLKKSYFMAILLCILGSINALYLSSLYILQSSSCVFGFSCADVLMPSFGSALGIPIPFLGTAFFLTLMLCLIFFKKNFDQSFIFQWMPRLGFGVSVGLMVVMLVITRHFCMFCAISFCIATSLFVLSTLVVKNSSIRCSKKEAVFCLLCFLTIMAGLKKYNAVCEQFSKPEVLALPALHPSPILLGNPKATTVITVISDPECPKCHRIMDKLNRLAVIAPQTYRIEIFLYPILEHKHSRRKALGMIKKFYPNENSETVLGHHIRFAEQLGLNSVPVIFVNDKWVARLNFK